MPFGPILRPARWRCQGRRCQGRHFGLYGGLALGIDHLTLPEPSLHAPRPGPFGRLVAWVCRRAGLVAFLCLAAAGALAWLAAATLTINTSTDDMLSEELPFRAQNEALAAAFPQLVDTLIIAVEAPDALAAETAAERLAAALADRARVTQSVFLPQGGDFFRHNGLLFLPAGELQALADRLAEAQPLLAALQADPSLRGLAGLLEQALAAEEVAGVENLAALLDRLATVAEELPQDPRARLSWSAMLSDGEESAADRRRFVIVKPVIDFGSLTPLDDVVAAVGKAAEDLGLTDANGYRLRLTGEPLMLQDELVSVRTGIGIVGLISAALVAAMLFAGLRSWRLSLAILVTLAAGLACTAGFAALAVGELNIISVAFAVLFIGLSVDFGIHFGLRARECRVDGLSQPAALTEAARLIGGPLLLCAATTALAFFAFFPTAYRGLSELGLIAGAGMFIALFLSLTLLPALLHLVPDPVGRHSGRGPLARAADALQRRAARHARLLATVALLLALASALALPQVRFDDDPMNLRDPDSPSVAALSELFDDPRMSPYGAELLVEDLAAAEAVAPRLRALPQVEMVIGLADFVPQDQEAKLAILDQLGLFMAPLFIAPPPEPAPDAAARAAAVERLEATLARASAELRPEAGRLLRALGGPEGAAPTDLEAAWLGGFAPAIERLLDALEAQPVTLETLPDELVARYRADDGRLRLDVIPAEDLRNPAARERFVEAVQGVMPHIAGVAVTIVEAGRAVVDAFAQASLLALVAITLLLLVVLRSLLDTVLVLAPLILAALLTAALGVVFGLPFNFANVIVLPLLLGLGVDSGIHYVMRTRELAAGEAPGSANSTPRAIFLSALTTVASFASLSLSQHPGTASMGVLLTIALLVSLICVLAFLPALLALAGRLPRG